MQITHRYVDYLRALKGFVSILRDPDDTDAVFEIVRGLGQSRSFRRLVAELRSRPETARMMDERYLAPPPDLDELLKLPQDSLGHHFARRMRAQGLQVVFYPVFPVTDELSYVHMRLRATHDVWHTVASFDITPLEELGLQAFMLAQLASPLAAALIGGALLRSLLGEPVQGLEAQAVVDAVARGYQRGRQAAPLFAQKWEEGWAKPLRDWQRELGLPVTAT